MATKYLDKTGLAYFWGKIKAYIASSAPEKTTQTMATAKPAGTQITVPTHVVGGGRLVIMLNGVVCEEGASNQYIDYSTTKIKFNFALSAGDIVTAIRL